MSFNNIPAEMKALDNWLVWRLEERDGKPSKPPYSVYGGYGKSNDPATWCSFEEAVAAQAEGNYSGIGFVFTNTPFIGIDIDHSLSQGIPTPEAAAAIKTLSSYTELSQSGNGFHIVVKGKLPDGRPRKGDFEMYGEGSPRYFAMTGNLWGEYSEIRADQAAIDEVHSKYIADRQAQLPQAAVAVGQSQLTDEELLATAMRASNGERFAK